MEIRALHERIGRERMLIASGLAVGAALGAILFGSAAWQRSPDQGPVVHSTSIDADAIDRTAALRKEKDELERRVAELEVSRLKDRLATLETEQTAPDFPTQSPRSPSPVAASISVTASVPARDADTSTRGGERSLAYWNALNDIMAHEAEMRKPPTQITAENAAAFVSARGNAGRYATDAIRRLDRTGVDAEIATLAQEIATWYERGIALNDRAGSLLDSADSARQGTPGRSWRSGEEQHRKQCEEINRRGAQLRTRMTQKYKLAFPPLQ